MGLGIKVLIWAKREPTDIVKRGIVKIFPRLHRYCFVLTADAALADDLSQAVCLRALEKADQFQEKTNFDRWIFKIAQRLWIDELRKQAVRQGGGLLNVNDVDLVDLSPDPEASLLNREVLQSIMALPEAQRITVLLVYGEGYAYKEAAQILDIPVGTVMSRLAAARGKLVVVYQGKTRIG